MSEYISTEQREAYHRIKKVRVWVKGQFTIPADMRVRLGIVENTILEVFQVGKAIVVTPEKLIVKELAGAVSNELVQKEIDLKELLSELREGSHDYETE